MPAYHMLPADTQYSPHSEALPSPDILDPYYVDSCTTLPGYPFGDYYSNADAYYNRTAQTQATIPCWSPTISDTFVTPSTVSTAALGPSNPPLSTWTDHKPTYNAYPPGLLPNSLPTPLPTPRGHGSPVSPSQSPGSMRVSPPVVNYHQPLEDTNQKPPPRKRGRPRLYRPASDPAPMANTRPRSQCMPHTEVERKYREKLNMELERLRRAVPTLPQNDSNDSMGATKPSKSMVLAVAIDYIKELERQRDEAIEEVERLGGKVNFSRRRKEAKREACT